MNESTQFQLIFGDDSFPGNPGDVAAMPVWPENSRGFPLGMAVTSLFTTSNNAERKLYPRKTSVYSADDFQVYFSGEELRENSDKEVWLGLMHLARGRSMSKEDPIEVRFSGNDFLHQMGWSNDQRSYTKLSECLDRLQKAQIKLMRIKNGRRSGWITMSFISNVVMGLGNNLSGREKWSVRLDYYAAHLYRVGMIEITHSQRSTLKKALSKRLLDHLLATENEIFSSSIEDLILITGSGCGTKSSFKQNLKEALEELRLAKALHHFTFDKNIVYIAKTSDVVINRGVPKTLNIHKAMPTQLEEN